MGTTSAAVPEKNDSSADKTSSTLSFFTSKGIFNSLARSNIVLLVIPSKHESRSGEYKVPSFTIKKFSPLPSAT